MTGEGGGGEAVGEAPGEAPGEQLALLRSTVRRARSRPPKPQPEPAAVLPVARVAVDVSLAHLDRPFDYLVTAEQAEAAQPGVRVRVRFAGRLVDGYVLERVDSSDHEGRLAALHKVVSPEPVLSLEVARLAREVADHYAGSMADVLRLAVPPRHARTERQEPALAAPRYDRPGPGPWQRYPRGRALLDAVHAGAAPRAVWSALPGPTWPAELAVLVGTAVAAGHGALVVVPDHRDVDRVVAAVDALLGPGAATVLSADLGPATRYSRWLSVRRGHTRMVVGTRAAMFAPVQDLGLAVVWDDGDDLHEEPRAPYPHVRTVLGLRSRLEGAALVVGGFARTAEAAALVRARWAEDVSAARETVRAVAPAVRALGDDADYRDPEAGAARLPTLAWRTAHEALATGPVLVQVPRAGYRPGLACATCRAPARCATCAGPLAGAGHGPPSCRWCGRPSAGWSCPVCSGSRLRATVVGSERTAEELGRAFPRVPVRSSGAGAVLATVGAEPALVVATPGAEPVAEGGYAAALLLDGWALLGRPDLRAGEEALRRWAGAAALVRPAPDGGRVVVLADSAAPAVQALVRWDPAGFADRELAERTALRLPPAARLVSLTGEPAAVQALLATAALPEGADLLGPVPVVRHDGAPDANAEPVQERVLVRAPRAAGRRLAAALHAATGVRSAHKDAGAVRVQVDPREVA